MTTLPNDNPPMSEPIRQTIRQTPSRLDSDFDDPLWPINCLVLIMAGLAAGLVLATSEFPPLNTLDLADSSSLHTGWFRLTTVALLLGVAILAAVCCRRWIARRLMFCVLLGLLTHVGLAVYLNQKFLEPFLKPQAAYSTPTDDHERVVLPDYQEVDVKRADVRREFEKPVETVAPQELPPPRVEQQQPTWVTSVATPKPAELTPETPDAVRADRRDLSTRRRADEPADMQLDRLDSQYRPQLNDAPRQPQTRPAAASPPRRLETTLALLDRRPTAVPTHRSQPSPQAPDTARTQDDVIRPDRRTFSSQPEPERLASSQPNPSRRVSHQTELHDQPVELSQPAAASPAPGRAAVDSSPSAIRRQTPTNPRIAAGSSPAQQLAHAAPTPSPLNRAAASVELPDVLTPNAPTDTRVARSQVGRLDLPLVPAAQQDLSGSAAAASVVGVGQPTRLETGRQTMVERIADASPSGEASAAAGSARFGAATSGNVAVAGPTRARTAAATPSLSGGGLAPLGPRRAARHPSPSDMIGSDAVIDPTVDSGGPAAEQAPAVAPDANVAGPGRRTAGLAAAATDPLQPDTLGASASPGDVVGPRRSSRSSDPRSSLDAPDANRISPPRQNTARLPSSLALGEGLPTPPKRLTEGLQSSPSESLTGPSVASSPRREQGLPSPTAATPGGAASRPGALPAVGIPHRSARATSALAGITPGYIPIERTPGVAAIDARVHQGPSEAFRRRTPDQRERMTETYGGSSGTEQAVELGLDFLARHQFADGHWSVDRFPDQRQAAYRQAQPGEMNADTAASGLSLLAFLGATYTHQDGKHQESVDRGLQWLIANQQPDGRLYSEAADRTRYARSYGHGIATIALCEAYGMTRDPALREPAEKAVGFILASQSEQLGGWRYEPNGESDTSISGWQLMALKSAQMAGIDVPDECFARVGRWLDVARASDGVRYRYNPYSKDTPQQRAGREPSLAMTAEGLLMRMYLGSGRDRPDILAGGQYLKDNPPAFGTADNPLRDTYYWYYATQAMFHLQGDCWEAWNERMHPLLVTSQTREGPLAGSWSPTQPTADRWAQAGGRHYVTTMHLLILEVYYRHLPLFDSLAGEADP